METIYPTSELIAFTVLNIFGNLLGFVGNIVAKYGIFVIIGIMVPLYLYLMFGYKTDLKRLKIENKEMFL